MSWKTKNCYAEDVLKTSSRRLEDQQMFAGVKKLIANIKKLICGVTNLASRYDLLLHYSRTNTSLCIIDTEQMQYQGIVAT